MTSRQAVEPVLSLTRLVKISAQPALTTSEQYFEEAGVSWTGWTFQTQFWGLEVPANGEAELVVRKCNEMFTDASILAELGDEAEVSVSQFWACLPKSRKSRKSSEWFVFYLCGKDGNLWAVHASWRTAYSGWYVNAYPIDNSNGWRAGYQVVSRN